MVTGLITKRDNSSVVIWEDVELASDVPKSKELLVLSEAALVGSGVDGT